MTYSACYDCPLGLLEISCDQGAVTSVHLTTGHCQSQSPSPLSDLAAVQITEYLEGKRKNFDFPMNPRGTDFQKAVWSAMQQIPYGETRTYGQIAAAIGRPKAARAVGQAANRNPIWVVVPCHRVVGAHQELTGYAGGLALKHKLLELEQTYR